MNLATCNSMQLLAEQVYYSHEWGHLNKLLTDNYREAVIIATVTLLVIAAMLWQAISRRRRRDFDFDSPPRLFADLCRAHRLSWSDRRLLKELAAARGLKSPTALFVEPEYFDMTSIPLALRASAAELRSLRRRLFD